MKDNYLQAKRILITAGGTGGHLYPAQALAQQLRLHSTLADCLFVAGGLGTNRYFDRHHFSFHEIPCTPLLSKNPLKCFKGMINLFKGIKQSIAILKKYRPHVVVGFGSYYTTSVLFAAKWLNIPIVLHEANSVPGKANKWLASLATCIGLHFPSTASHFKKKTALVGLPLREGYQLNAIKKENALSYYGFSSNCPVLLICGGSQGARAINQLIENCLPVFKSLSLQLIHLTGDREIATNLQTIYSSHGISAVVKKFEDKMQFAWSAADAFVGRSGASTIAESMEFEVPGILIPYPFATDNHQEKNADFLVEQVGLAKKLLECKLTSEELSNAIAALFDPNQSLAFKEAIKEYKRRPHQQTLCDLVLQIACTRES